MQGKKWRTPERERQVIDLYLQHHSVTKVAQMVDCGPTTVQNILKANGVKQDGRQGRKPRPKKPKPQPKLRRSHCNSKYCPALVMMLNTTYGWRAKQIAEATGYKMNGVQNILCRHGFERRVRVNKADYDLDQIEHEYAELSIPGRQLDEKYGLSEGTVCKWMRQRGITFGKGAHQERRQGRSKADGEFIYSERMQEINQRKHDEGEQRFIQNLERYYGDRFEYVGGFRDGGKTVATVRCKTCGHEFVHSTTRVGEQDWQCPECIRRERERHESERDGKRYERMFAEIREYAIEKTCAECGAKFQSANPTTKYCCQACARRVYSRLRSSGHRHYYHVKYGDAYLEHYDSSITLRALYERDGGACQICGGQCDWNDKEWGANGPSYPSIDHIVPRAQGGDHFWSNVQLAHCICNSRKRDLPDQVVKATVTWHVQPTQQERA